MVFYIQRTIECPPRDLGLDEEGAGERDAHALPAAQGPRHGVAVHAEAVQDADRLAPKSKSQ